MSYKCFIFIKEVIENYLTSFIIKEAYYLTIIKFRLRHLKYLLFINIIVVLIKTYTFL
jgi:hypothetical protein